MQLVRHPVGRQVPSAKWQLAVAAGLKRASPYPVLIRRAAVDFRPKANIKRFSRAVSCNVTKWLALYPSCASVRLSRDWSGLTAAAHAKAGGVRDVIRNRVLLFVAANIFHGLPFYPAGFAAGVCCNPSFLTTTALAVTVRDFSRRLFGGKIAHVVSSSRAGGHATGRSQRSGGFFIEVMSIIPQGEGVG